MYEFSGTFHPYVMLRYCKFSGTFHSCVMPRYCKFSGTFHSYVMLRYCKFSGTFHSMRHATLLQVLWNFPCIRHATFQHCRHTNVGPVLEVFARFLASSHGFETQRPWAFDDAPVSDTICVHVVLALYLKQSRSAKVLGRTRSVAVTNTGIKTCQVEYFKNSHKPQKW